MSLLLTWITIASFVPAVTDSLFGWCMRFATFAPGRQVPTKSPCESSRKSIMTTVHKNILTGNILMMFCCFGRHRKFTTELYLMIYKRIKCMADSSKYNTIVFQSTRFLYMTIYSNQIVNNYNSEYLF